LEELKKIYSGNKTIFIAKEITKIYEDIGNDSIDNWIDYLKKNNNEKLKGEFIIVVPKKLLKENNIPDYEIERLLRLLLDNNVSYNSAIKITSSNFKINKNSIYKKYINLAKK
jgi:16S rRNA (cytidine1402-2'-O)-methyltransferase